MRMTIKLVNSDGHACGGPSAVFDEQGGTIGRRVDCTLVIPDKDRHVSRIHALVQFRGDYFSILDKGSFLPVVVNGMRVGQGHETPVFEGDFIQIGTFGMRVEHVETAWDLSPEGRRALGVEPLVTSPPGRQVAAAPMLPAGDASADAGAASADGGADTGSEMSPNGDANAARPKRTRRKSAAGPRGKGSAGRGSMDNPESTYEPGGREEPVEQVEALLSRLGEVITSTIAVPRTTPEAPLAPAGENRPAFSTFDLLADRLQAGDEQLDPFMPAVWDDPAGQPSGGTEPAAEGANDHLAAMREIAASVTAADAAATEAEPAPVEAAAGDDQHPAEAPSAGGDVPADDGPVRPMPVTGVQAIPESAPESVPQSVPEAGNVLDAAPEVPRLDDLVIPGAHQVAATPAGAPEADASVADASGPSDDFAILERVVRRRRRRAAIAAGPAPADPVSGILVDVPAAMVVESAASPLSDEPAIVLVMQPVHGGPADTDAVGAADYAIPVRRRNRRQPAPATGAVRSAH